MAVLDSLQLQGIRSFGPEHEDAQVVKFFSPVTLFLGQNGSGKTTVIESLKYACSGELPPNSSKGQGFVHDPKITNSSSTKGQVKLKFLDAKGDTVTIVKSMQVLQLKDGLKFKSLDQTIRVKSPDGKETALNHKCAEIDNIICNHFGVAQPVINNVIFCQQDNAQWPLDDGKKLKEKFDDIFNIGTYNDAVDNLRKLVKEKKVELKLHEQALTYKQERKTEVDKKQKSLTDKSNEIDTLKKEIVEKTNLSSTYQKKLSEIAGLEQKITKIMSDISGKESDKNSVRKQQSMLSANISEEFNGTDEELNKEIQQFETKRKEDEVEVKSFEIKLQQLEDNEKQINQVINKLQVKLGELKEKQQQQETRISNRDSLITDACTKMDIPQSAFDAEIINNLKHNLQILKSNKLEIQRQHKVEDKTIQDKILKIREERACTSQDIVLKKEAIAETQEKFRNISAQLHDLNVSDEQLNNYLQKITKIEKELDGLNKSFDSDSVIKKMTESKQKIINLEIEQEQFEKERKLLQKNCILEHEIDTKKILVVKKESDINKLKDKHFRSFHILFNEMPESNFKKLLQNRIFECEKDINTVRKDVESQQKIVTCLEQENKMKTQEKNTLKEKLNKNQESIRKIYRGQAVDKHIQELHLQIEGLQKDKGEYKSLKIMYEKYIKHLKDEMCCPICDTGFKDKKDTINKLVINMASKIKRLPEDIKNCEQQLLIKQKQHSDLVHLKSIKDELEAQLPPLEKALETIEEKTKSAVTTLAAFEDNLKSSNKTLKTCNEIIADATLIDQHQHELGTTKSEISELGSKIITVPSSMSLVQVDEKLEDIKEELSTTRKSCDTLQRKLNQNNERRQDLTQERNSIVEKQLNLQKAVQGRPLLEDQRIDLVKNEEKLKTLLDDLDAKIVEVTVTLAEEKDKLEQLREAHEVVYKELEQNYHTNEKLVDDIIKLQNEIDSCIAMKTEEKFNSTKEDLCNLKIREQNTMDATKEILQKMNDIRRKLDGHDNVFKSLNENLRLRELRKEETAIETNINTLKENLKNYNHQTILDEKLTYHKKFMSAEKEIVYIEGNLSEIQKSYDELENDLRKPDNVNAYRDYKIKLFETHITKRTIQDIERFSKTLENSIIKFHATRMKQINMIIKELWQSIYRGNDIEYIKIKTDESTGTRTRRTYNYKVVQFRNNVEMEMSGRCSAGQKVLACLLIRMALAETFSDNCGILALDEPTTNLDRENIESLCEGLFRIINSRQTQKNFQLLIITHDSYFLNTLRNIGGSEYYYNVSRDTKGNSLIARQSL